MRRLLLATLGLTLCASPAYASEGRWALTAAGDPALSTAAVKLPIPGSSAEWWTCPASDRCQPSATGERWEPGTVARGTIFENGWGGITLERSPMWLGRVAATTRPALSGTWREGDPVRAVGAQWSGGWATDQSVLGILACPSLTRTDCVPVAAGQPVPAELVGRYLYAVEYRHAADAAVQVFAATRPAPSALVAVSAPRGPVTAARSVELRKRALRTNGTINVGRVTCSVRCRVVATVSGGGQEPTVKRLTVEGSKAITVPSRRGRLRVRVELDGRLAASGRVVAR